MHVWLTGTTASTAVHNRQPWSHMTRNDQEWEHRTHPTFFLSFCFCFTFCFAFSFAFSVSFLWLSILTGTRTSLTCLAYQGKRRGHRISDNPFNLTQYDVVVTSYRTCCIEEVRNVTNMKKRVKNNGKKENQGWISQTSKSTAAQNNSQLGASRLHCVSFMIGPLFFIVWPMVSAYLKSI